MSYIVNWSTDKVISVPTTDLILVSGTEYNLNMSDFLIEIRRLEGSDVDGLYADQILDHTNSKVIAGVTYFPFDEIINGYTVQFTGVATRVNLLGTNNNIVDVLIANGITVVPSNSAGGQTIFSGSGLDAGQDTKLTRIHALLDIIENGLDHAQIMKLLLANSAGSIIQQTDGSYVIKSSDGTKDRISGDDAANGGRTISATDVS